MNGAFLLTEGRLESVAFDLQPNELAVFPSRVKPVNSSWASCRDSPLLLNGRGRTRMCTACQWAESGRVDLSPAAGEVVPLSQGGVRVERPGHPFSAGSYRRQQEDLGTSVPCSLFL